MRTRDLLNKAADWIERNPDRWITGMQCSIGNPDDPKTYNFCAQGVILAVEYGDSWPKKELVRCKKEEMEEIENIARRIASENGGSYKKYLSEAASDVVGDVDGLEESHYLIQDLLKKNKALSKIWNDNLDDNDDLLDVLATDYAESHIDDTNLEDPELENEWRKLYDEFVDQVKNSVGIDSLCATEAAKELRALARKLDRGML